MGSDVVFSSLYLGRWLRSGWYLDIVMLLLLGVASLMCRTNSVVFELLGSWVWRWLTWRHLIFWPIVPLVPHCGTSHFIQRFVDPHIFARSLSLTGCSLRRGHDRYLTEPPRSIQLVSYFSTLRCHHASPSGRSSWMYVHDSVMDSDDQYYMFDDRWLHVMLFFGPVAHLMPYWGIFSVSDEIYGSSLMSHDRG